MCNRFQVQEMHIPWYCTLHACERCCKGMHYSQLDSNKAWFLYYFHFNLTHDTMTWNKYFEMVHYYYFFVTKLLLTLQIRLHAHCSLKEIAFPPPFCIRACIAPNYALSLLIISAQLWPTAISKNNVLNRASCNVKSLNGDLEPHLNKSSVNFGIDGMMTHSVIFPKSTLSVKHTVQFELI